MSALLGYHTALLMRSQRWLPPMLLYAAVMGIGVQWGQPVLDGLGYAAAGLLPVTAWVVRICLNIEPLAARQCTAAAAGPARVHLAGVLAALLLTCALGAVGAVYVVAVSDPRSSAGHVAVPLLPAVEAGLLAAFTCAFFGAAIGALCNRPLLSNSGVAVPSSLLAVLLVLVVGGSPANAAVAGLVSASHEGAVTLPWLPAVASVAVAALATWLACSQAGRRG
ncbi:hypothetical protein H181DRAFT_03789 [Streptomyces sp. WMMB 714]|jgi:hypothetical protein|uniref:hypothetical protein n=1 Tax=Streptomyces sp. WMMB 714 TaxID=1286822 RepID=UPI0005F877AD|nr:hypothetical protein [Streptomyces sp. WMMB 714]SCK43342.1 hypothetical protein H181DRAFT_03789 [Streptomyces sp. WMMB 714]